MRSLIRWFGVLCLALAACCLRPDSASAQEVVPDTLYQVRLTDGSVVVGRIESRSADRIVLVTLAGVRLDLLTTQVRSLAPASGRVVNGAYWPPDPNPSRLSFAPTGRSVGKGSGYVGVFWLALPFVAYGVTDRITLAGGAPVLFGQFDVFYLAPKVEVIRAPGTSIALGILSFFAPAARENLESTGIAYAVGTFGNRDHAFTAAVGFGYDGEDVAGQPAVMVGGETRVSRRIKLMSENYFIAGENDALISAGMRILGERMTGDIGMMGFLGEFCCVPVVNLSYSIGKQR